MAYVSFMSYSEITMYLDYDPFLIPDRVFTRKRPQRMRSGQLRVLRDASFLSFGELADGDLLDTSELCFLFGCSKRTLYRWISERGLRPRAGVGRELYFAKADVVNWFNSSNRPPGPGRPKLS